MRLQGDGGTTIVEGQASIHFPAGNAVFYNNVQEYNRDLSTCVLDTFGRLLRDERRAKAAAKGKPFEERGLRILEALSATGLRSIRYFKEIDGVSHVLANDLVPTAVETIRRNVLANGLDPRVVVPNCGDANDVMRAARSADERYDVIDLDPYGSAAPFITAAVSSVADGGLLAVTCTDMAVLSGNHPETCYAKYASMPLHKRYLHEFALRIVLSTLERHAALHSRHIVPLLTLSIDFYLRTFVRVFDSKQEAQEAATRLGQVFHCGGCDDFHMQPLGELRVSGRSRKFAPSSGPVVGPLCVHCGGKFRMGGPIWLPAIHSTDFIAAVLARLDASPGKFRTEKRMRGMLSMASEELQDCPLYWDVPQLASLFRASTPQSNVLRSALLHAGYRVSSTHASDTGLKTNAPAAVLFDIMRAWVRLHPAQPTEGSPGARLLATAPSIEVNFAPHDDAASGAQRRGLVRFQVNPEPNWGPKARATGKRGAAEAGLDAEGTLEHKRAKLQGRRGAAAKSSAPASSAQHAAASTAAGAASSDSEGSHVSSG